MLCVVINYSRLSFGQDVVQEIGDIVGVVISINCKRLVTKFSCYIICPVRAANLVAEALTTSGAANTQQSFMVVSHTIPAPAQFKI